MNSSAPEVATQLNLIADELDQAASAILATLTSRSRELRAWAARIRRQVELIRDELDQDSATRSADAIGAAQQTGLTFANKALIVLATVSGLADAPDAIGTAVSVVENTIAVVTDLLPDYQHSLDIVRPPSSPRQAEDPLDEWLNLASKQPARHIGEYQVGICDLLPGKGIGVAQARTFQEVSGGDAISIEIAVEPLVTYDGGCAIGSLAEQLLRTGHARYEVRLRCLGAIAIRETRGYAEAAFVEEASQTQFLIEEAIYVGQSEHMKVFGQIIDKADG